MDFWTQPDMVAVLSSHEAYTLLNIANDPGNGSESDTDWTQGYVAAITRPGGARGATSPTARAW